MILSCQNICKSFGENQILNNVSFQIEENQKFGIYGCNGTGKSTLLKIIMGQLEADSGIVALGRDIRIGYLAQYQVDEEHGSIYDIVLSARADLLQMESQLRSMEEEMSEIGKDQLEAFLDRYHRLSDEFERLGGLTYRSEVTGVLKGLSFSEDDFDKPLTSLSGGQKTRVSLGKLLVSSPDLLLLDEPINHLDLSSIEWLEGFIAAFKGSVIIVAHDRYFLDRTVDHIVDLSNHSCYAYKGNYSQFVIQKDERMLTLMREYEKQQKEIAHQEAVIEKLRSYNREKSIKRAESRVKLLNKMDRLENPSEYKHEMKLNLMPSILPGNDILSVSDIKKQYKDNLLFSNLSFDIYRNERVAIIGDNGTGKTTILKIVNDLVSADTGLIKFGSNVVIGYYDQEQQVLTDSNNLFEEISNAYPDLDNTRIRNVLAAFLFTGEDVFKQISMLSGGERARLSLAKLMLSGANFLILDEPTNHLDMESKEALEEALNEFEGTLLFVSHDRYFINKCANRILELRDHKLFDYKGNYSYYLEKKNLNIYQSNEESDVNQESSDKASKIDFQEQKRLQAEKRKKENALKKTEEDIEKLEEEISRIDQEFLNPDIQRNSEKLTELNNKQSLLKEELEDLYQEWERLAE